jgi:predicted ArsR family transcriptional regulator
MLGLLNDHGFQPTRHGDGVRLANCPFEALARAHSALICGMNVELLVSLADALPMLRLKPRLDPGPDRCCVTFARSGA